MNVRDSEVICGLLRTKNYELTTNPDEADIIIFNTCSVRQHAEDKVWSEIGKFKIQATGDRQQAASRKPQTADRPSTLLGTRKPIIGLVGCMAQNYRERIFERAPQVDFVVGPSDIHKIPEIINRLQATSNRLQATSNRLQATSNRQQAPKSGDSPFFQRKIWETDGSLRPEEIYHIGFYEDKDHAYVVISEGCSNYCSYCVVPYVRGELHNRNYKDILREIEEAMDKGITRITLLGQNVNTYRAPEHQSTRAPVDFIGLLRIVNAIKGLKEFSFITSHPKDTSLELFKAMAECEKLKKYLHLPVQSGADRMLGLMNRGYNKKFYLDLVENYRKIVKGAALSTDIIVGFPTETEEDFQSTYGLVEDVQFNSAYIFKYSPRPNTEAARLSDDVPTAEKERRHRLILDLQKEISLKKK